MKKFITAIIAVCLWASVALATHEKGYQPMYVQPEYSGYSKTIDYFSQTYYKVGSTFGIAGYKTIDKMVQLEKSEFHADAFLQEKGDKIFMVQVLPSKEIVGYGIKVEDSEFSLEDSNCDGIMDKVGLFNDPVFPPDCFHSSNQLLMTMDELAEDLEELSKEIAPALKYLGESFSGKGD